MKTWKTISETDAIDFNSENYWRKHESSVTYVHGNIDNLLNELERGDSNHYHYNNRHYINIDVPRLVSNQHHILQSYCFLQKKFGLYLSFEPFFESKATEETLKAAPILKFADLNSRLEGFALFLFDSFYEAYNQFETVVGDDGPTKFNKYDGPVRVYAQVIDNLGQFVTENT